MSTPASALLPEEASFPYIVVYAIGIRLYCVKELRLLSLLYVALLFT